ncbi:MAG: polysaccharide deacetylase family protein [Alphaproteobacteria bacterium]
MPPAHEDALDHLLARIGQRHGFAEPSLLLSAEGGERAHGAPVLVTFDDGFRSNHRVAERLLARHGVTAVFFICPGLMDLGAADQSAAVARLVFRGAVSAPPPLMSWGEVEALAAAGHTIAAHTLTHRALAGLPPADLAAEVLQSGERIEQRLGRPVDWFAYPFGDIDSIDLAAMGVIAGRYRLCRSGVRGLNDAGTDPLGLLAEPVDLSAPPAYQDLALEGGLDVRHAAARTRLAALVAARM